LKQSAFLHQVDRNSIEAYKEREIWLDWYQMQALRHTVAKKAASLYKSLKKLYTNKLSKGQIIQVYQQNFLDLLAP
jgi:hypothetical protein